MAFAHTQAGDNVPGWIAVGIIAAVFMLLQRLRTQPNISNFPLLGKEYGGRRKRAEAFMRTPIEVYRKGYEKFKDQIYRVTTLDGQSLPLCSESLLMHVNLSIS